MHESRAMGLRETTKLKNTTPFCLLHTLFNPSQVLLNYQDSSNALFITTKPYSSGILVKSDIW